MITYFLGELHLLRIKDVETFQTKTFTISDKATNL